MWRVDQTGQKDLADFADRAHQLTMAKSTSVDVKSERMRNSLAGFSEWILMGKTKRITKAVLVASRASETVPDIS
jgi:hypothetical protein